LTNKDEYNMLTDIIRIEWSQVLLCKVM